MSGADYLTLTDSEAAFLTAAADAIIPADALSPSASQCGVIDFIDCELAGAYGDGARLYRDGPVLKGKPEHGYQLDLTPRDFFRRGIEAAENWISARFGKTLAQLDQAQCNAALTAMEKGEAEFAGFAAGDFFEALLAIVMEGFFADPYYGGNRDLAAWKMIGYPGLMADYQSAMEKYRGKRYPAAPRSIGDFA